MPSVGTNQQTIPGFSPPSTPSAGATTRTQEKRFQLESSVSASRLHDYNNRISRLLGPHWRRCARAWIPNTSKIALSNLIPKSTQQRLTSFLLQLVIAQCPKLDKDIVFDIVPAEATTPKQRYFFASWRFLERDEHAGVPLSHHFSQTASLGIEHASSEE